MKIHEGKNDTRTVKIYRLEHEEFIVLLLVNGEEKDEYYTERETDALDKMEEWLK